MTPNKHLANSESQWRKRRNQSRDLCAGCETDTVYHQL